MNNLEALALWTPFAKDNYAGDVTVPDGPNVDFWFVANGARANEEFHCFANGGDGSLVAIRKKDGSFDAGPIVHLGHEGEVFVVAEDVPHALALFAADGSSYESLLYAVAGSSHDGGEVDAALAAFVKKHFGLDVPKDPVAAIRAVDAKHGAATRALVAELNG